MFFALDRALAALPELGSRTRAALARLLPGAVTVLLDNPQGRFPLACGADPATLGLRVPALSGAIEALGSVATAVLQSSANRAGGADARAVGELDPRLRAAADLVLDGGPLPGTPSTIVDLRTFERDGGWRMLREGAIAREQLVGLLGPQAPRSTAHAAVRDRDGAGVPSRPMRIALASDHAGFELKELVKAQLTSDGHDVVDVGPESDASTDYPRFARPAARLVAEGDAELGVLACGSGVGVAIVANKVPGVRAVNAHDPEEAQLARAHNDANVVTLSGRRLDGERAGEIVRAFIDAQFEGGRHARRVALIEERGQD
jgi:ribose 5-phosphate isomerase B